MYAARFEVLAEDNATARTRQRLHLTLNMEDLHDDNALSYQILPTNASRANTFHNGDVMLYGSCVSEVFYKVFSSSYSYTHVTVE